MSTMLSESLAFSDCGSRDFDDDTSAGDSVQSSSKHNIARKDIELMNIVRAIGILFILTVTTITADVVFIKSRSIEVESFTTAYEEATEKSFETFLQRIDKTLWAAKSVAEDVRLAVEANPTQAWPYISIPEFSSRTEGALRLSYSSSVSVSPVVKSTQKTLWELYVVDQSAKVVQTPSIDDMVNNTDPIEYYSTNRSVAQGIYIFQNKISKDAPDTASLFVPLRHFAPALSKDPNNLRGILFDQLSTYVRAETINRTISERSSSMTRFLFEDSNSTDFADHHTPFSTLYYPIVNHTDREVVAVVGMDVDFTSLFRELHDKPRESLDFVVENRCGGTFTFEVAGPEAFLLAVGNEHVKINDVSGYVPRNLTYEEFDAVFEGHSTGNSSCPYQVTAYATESFTKVYLTNGPNVNRAIVLAFFFMITAILVGYDCLVERRQSNVVDEAERSDALVRSLFPVDVRDRLYEIAKRKEDEKKKSAKDKHDWTIGDSNKGKMMGLTHGPHEHEPGDMDDPIADLYPDTTILFSDLAGFTAWSSDREPAQVFKLLETIYRSMDKIAKRLSVFKVETIGDCYVAATGLPQAQPDHAERMARFARTSLVRVNALTSSLEAELGPGTAELSMRIGIHSGPVTAGVLRGQKARFQLFGDSMNMASRMESTGVKNKIQLSAETADMLVKSQKQHWFTPRSDPVFVKGKGEMQTFWLLLGSHSSSVDGSDDSATREAFVEAQSPTMNQKRRRRRRILAGTDLENVLGVTNVDEASERLVEWNSDVLMSFLKRIMIKREVICDEEPSQNSVPSSGNCISTGLVLDEIQTVIKMPHFDERLDSVKLNQEIELHSRVYEELKDYVACIASGYRRNAFHSFEHASHVTLSANKLLKRIINPDGIGPEQKSTITQKELYKLTYGIGADPLVQFAVVFAALVHDVGHTGHSSNDQLSQEKPDLADRYMNRSIAEQHSVDVAWNLLMLPNFRHLRACIYHTEEESQRFRHLLVNSVMATDIFDSDLKAQRKVRWERSFATEKDGLTDDKATVVIEHLIQASDVSHTMQHWHVFTKWNRRLFMELYNAFRAGRSEQDPSEGWYERELRFFDNYVVPLAKRLEDCGVLGVSSIAYLQHAQHNRSEWLARGRQICSEMLQEALQNTERIPALGNTPHASIDETCTESSSDYEGSHCGEDEEAKSRLLDAAEEIILDVTETQRDRDELVQDLSRAVVLPAILTEKVQTGALFESSAGNIRVVRVPSGKLDIVIETHWLGPMVHSVGLRSPVYGELFASDCILAIDGISTHGLSSEAIDALLTAKSDQPKTFTVQQVESMRFT